MQEMDLLLHSTIFCMSCFCKSLEFFGTSIPSLDPETVQLPTFSIISALFTGACAPPEKLSLTLEHSAHLVKLAYDIEKVMWVHADS